MEAFHAITHIDRRRIPILIGLPALIVLSVVAPATAQPNYPERVGAATQVACAPRLLARDVDISLTLVGSQEGRSQFYYGPRDTLVLSGGSDHGVQVGQEFFVRRVVAGPLVQLPAIATAGWVRIVAVDARSAIAQVVDACDGMRAGDFLTPTVWPDLSAMPPDGAPDYTDPAHVLFTLDSRRYIATGDYAVIDRGDNAGLTIGQQLTIFRYTLGDDGPVTELAKAIALLIESDHATIRLTESRDAVQVGDLIAPHR